MGPIFTFRASEGRRVSKRDLRTGARAVTGLVVLALLLPASQAFGELTSFPTVAPPPPQQSRKKGQDMAKAMAMAGAAFAGAMCVMMLKKASETEDPNQKMMYQMMAMQECKQVPESLAKAGENEDGANTMTQPAAPGQQAAQAATGVPLQPSTAPAATSAPLADSTKEVPTYAPLDFAQPTSGVVAADDFENKTPLTTATPKPTGGVAVDGTTDLAAMTGPKVGFDETSSANNGVSTVGSGGGLLGSGANGSGTDSKVGDGKTGIDEKKDGIGRQASKTAGEAGEGAGGGAGGNANGKAADGIDAMIAQMMGGMHGGDGGTLNMGSTSGALAVGAPRGADGEPLPNIFEYATFRYRELVDEEKMLFDGSIAAHRNKRTDRAVAKNDAPKKDREKGVAKADGNRAPASVAPIPMQPPSANPAIAAARSAAPAGNDKSQAQIDARMAPTKVRMAGGLR